MSGVGTVLPVLVAAGSDAASLEVDVLVLAVGTTDGEVTVTPVGISDDAARTVTEAARAIGHTGAPGSVSRIPSPLTMAAGSVLLVGVGDIARAAEEGRPDRQERLRRAAGEALRALASTTSVGLALPTNAPEDAEAVALGALLGSYRYTTHLSDRGEETPRTISLVTDGDASAALERATTLARAVAAARDLVNAPPSHLFPSSFADLVVASAQSIEGAAVAVEVIDEHALRERGFGGLVGVGSGSAHGPRLVKVSYTPPGSAQHLAVVGKGITFDSGGISIKPAANMEKMKSDMAGAAAAVEALFAIAELAIPVRVTAWLALAENMPSGSALRPSDVVRIYGGKSVEVINTDAEGRLVLADALVAAQEEQPDLLIDIATLTGAQVAALGYRTSAVMGTPAARDAVLAAADAAGEPVWPMPIPEEMLAGYESRTADIKNTGKPGGGMLGAAAFLREFVEPGVEWAHLDIAGPAYSSDHGYGYISPGATGVSVRTVVELARRAASGGLPSRDIRTHDQEQQ